MKLRRAMAIAAATAVIAPAALLAAPAAYADVDPATQTSTGSTGTETPGDADPDTATNPGTETDPDGEPDTADADPDDEADPGTEPDGKTDPGTNPDGEADPGTDSDGDQDPDDKPGDDEDEDHDTDPGEDDEEFPVCEEASIQVSLGGFPNKIVAGSGWKNFTFNVQNTGKNDIESLTVYTVATYLDSVDEIEDKLIDKYAHFEHKNPESGEWVDPFAGSGFNNGLFIDEFALDSGQKKTVELRVMIDKGAPAGDGLAIAAGTYGDVDTETCFENGDIYPFSVVKAGSEPGNVDDAKPSGEKPPADIKPQGEIKEIAVAGNLAETGSSSALPTIGIVGGITIVAGAGVVFAMKRRKGDAVA